MKYTEQAGKSDKEGGKVSQLLVNKLLPTAGHLGPIPAYATVLRTVPP